MPTTQPEKRINTNPSKPIHSFSNFRESLQYDFANTFRFGEIGVHYAADVVPSENGKLINSHSLRSYTMPKPLMQDFWMRKTYGLIPLSAIIPNNYEKYILIPNRGEDINAQLIGTSVRGFIGNVQSFLNQLYSRASNDYGVSDGYTLSLRFVIVYDMLFSRGSLLKSMGLTIAGTNSNPDTDVDAFWSNLSSQLSENTPNWLFKLTIRDKSWYVGTASGRFGVGHISLREAISKMRDDLSFTIEVNDSFDLNAYDLSQFAWSALDSNSEDSAPIDIARFYGYQIFCAHFFSNDHVDSIYSAELWRQNLYSLVKKIIGNTADTTFLWNGVSYRYDVCAAFIFEQISAAAVQNLPSGWNLEQIGYFCDYLRLIFGFNRSLRFGDYFTGSRTLPLAPGDVSVEVNGDSFSVVESIQKSWYARLFAQIQRVGRKISAQTKALFPDVNIVQDWHEPIWLGETTSSVYSEEIDNTGDEQFNPEKPISTTAVLRSKQDALGFELRVPDRFGVVIGFTWFDIARFYANATERSFFHVSRFDKFNEFLQFNGDQPIYKKELTPDVHSLDEYFSYSGRYMEYKQRYSFCSGGFADDTLPGMIFKADDGKVYVDIDHLSSDYIRSYPAELDKFYLSLSGWSLGHYFHFLVINHNDYDGNKPMAYNPTLD